MQPSSALPTVAVIGGYGGTGRAIAGALLQHSELAVRIVGRDLGRAECCASELAAAHGARVEARRGDATDAAGLAEALREVSVVVMATTALRAPSALPQAAVAAGTDVVDIRPDGAALTEASAHGGAVAERGIRYLAQAGFSPGLPSLLVRLAASRHPGIDAIRLGIVLGMAGATNPEQVSSFLELLPEMRCRVYDGAWREGSYSRDVETFDFPLGIGVRRCYPYLIEELEALPEELGVKKLGIYGAGTSWFTDMLVTPLAVGLHKLRPGLLRRPLSRMYLWGARHTGARASGAALLMDARRAGAPLLSAAVWSADAYGVTAAPVVAAVRQLLAPSSRLPAGLSAMGRVLDPEATLDDLRSQGISVTVEGAEP
ncbi:MAG: saccharopine dehydrogenase NADP-binding domain-containing protein [Candidatus Sericytochromatia bacterium]|nr:saccharopine dehydrogenase NADP-binding domain-containing protein [Candidatus Tanganyikabacteria bacterium]